jgi:hypothetical protein
VRYAPCRADARAAIDDGFAEQNNIVRRDADRLLDEVRAAAAALRPDKTNKDRVRDIERRFFHLQPQLGGSGGTGYFELDGEDFATVAAGLEAAMPAPSAGPNDVTTDAIGHADHDDEGTSRQTADGDPAFCDPIPHRVRARQRADALVLLAESFLAGTRTDGTPRRARPLHPGRLRAVQDLVGDVTARTARLLTAIHGANPPSPRKPCTGWPPMPTCSSSSPTTARPSGCPPPPRPSPPGCVPPWRTRSGVPVPGLSDAHPVHRLPPRQSP